MATSLLLVKYIPLSLALHLAKMIALLTDRFQAYSNISTLKLHIPFDFAITFLDSYSTVYLHMCRMRYNRIDHNSKILETT